MYNRKKKITDKIYKTLPVYEDEAFEHYHSYLDRLIISLEGDKRYFIKQENDKAVEIIINAITELTGLYETKQELITHARVKKIVMRHVNCVSKELKYVEEV